MRKFSAFSLIELLIVITIIALLLAFVIPAYGTMQSRTRLQRAGDQLIQLVQDAKTLATTGYSSSVGGRAELIGIRLTQGGSDMTLFSRPTEKKENVPLDSEHILRQISLGDVVVQKLWNADNQPVFSEATLFFYPPFGAATVESQETVLSHQSDFKIQLGVSQKEQTGLTKIISFSPITGRLQYE